MHQAKGLGNTGGRRPRRKRVLLIAGACAAAAIIGIFIWSTQRSSKDAPPPPAADHVKIVKFAATPQFAQLPLEQREEYLREMRSHFREIAAAAKNGQITREEQKAAFHNTIAAGSRIEMAKYFALPAGAQRQALLDRLIDEQERMREYASKEHPEDLPKQEVAAAQMKQFMESLPPEDRVKMAQFGYELFQRRQQRGLPIWPFSSR